jgi:RNA polymerase sigma factor (TIGR02999 family)
MTHNDSSPGQMTVLLQRAKNGDSNASRGVFDLLVQEMLQSARRMMQNERDGHTLQPTALVNEACVRLLQQDVIQSAENRRYLFGAANRAMQQILVDYARTRNADKRSGKWQQTSMDVLLDNFEAKNGVAFEKLYAALEALELDSARQREIIEHRYFGGFSVEQTAELMDISTATITREWRLARAKLYTLMGS